jgi:hypothetical protein
VQSRPLFFFFISQNSWNTQFSVHSCATHTEFKITGKGHQNTDRSDKETQKHLSPLMGKTFTHTEFKITGKRHQNTDRSDKETQKHLSSLMGKTFS